MSRADRTCRIGLQPWVLGRVGSGHAGRSVANHHARVEGWLHWVLHSRRWPTWPAAQRKEGRTWRSSASSSRASSSGCWASSSLPGDKDNIPIWLTVLCGIGGVVLGWFVYTAFGGNGSAGVDWVRWIVAIVVAAVLVVIASTVTGRNSSGVCQGGCEQRRTARKQLGNGEPRPHLVGASATFAAHRQHGAGHNQSSRPHLLRTGGRVKRPDCSRKGSRSRFLDCAEPPRCQNRRRRHGVPVANETLNTEGWFGRDATRLWPRL